MSQEEVVFLIAVTVVMPILALFIILNYQKARLKIKSERADQSLTTSELNTLIDESVEAATGPLHDRVSRLEKQMQPHDTAVLDQAEAEAERDEAASGDNRFKTLGRTRS